MALGNAPSQSEKESYIAPADSVTLGPDNATRAILTGGGLFLGAALGWALPYVAHWLASLPWAPWQGIAELINEWHNTWTGIAVIVVGTITGFLFGLTILEEMIEITLSLATLTIKKKDTKTAFPREDVSSIFFDGKDLVLLGGNHAESHRMVPEDIPRDDLTRALVNYGWPFHDEDPFATAVIPWVPHTQRLPDQVNVVLETRAEALVEGDHDRANALSRKLGTMGYIVRDRDGQQHVAPTGTVKT